MLISHSKKFIFIHVFKVAGSSIRKTLSPYCYPNKLTSIKNRLLNHKPIKSSDFLHHIKAEELKTKIPATIYNDYYKFGFVRNPWDWQVSIYHFTQQNPEHFQHEMVKKMNFEDYIKWRVEEAMCTQKEFLFDEKGNKIVDFIGRIENIEEDFSKVCNKLNIKTSLAHSNKSIHKDYRKMYNDETAQLIQDSYQEEIELFGYDFNGLK